MAKNRQTQTTKTQPPRRRVSQGTGFALGILAGLAIVAAIWFAYDSGRQSATPPASSTTATNAPAPQPQVSDAPPPPPAFTETEVAAVARIGAAEAKQLVDAGQAAVIDVRDPQSYAAGHVPGALQIPLDFVPGELPWFPRDKKLIFYCT